MKHTAFETHLLSTFTSSPQLLYIYIDTQPIYVFLHILHPIAPRRELLSSFFCIFAIQVWRNPRGVMWDLRKWSELQLRRSYSKIEYQKNTTFKTQRNPRIVRYILGGKTDKVKRPIFPPEGTIQYNLIFLKWNNMVAARQHGACESFQ